MLVCVTHKVLLVIHKVLFFFGGAGGGDFFTVPCIRRYYSVGYSYTEVLMLIKSEHLYGGVHSCEPGGCYCCRRGGSGDSPVKVERKGFGFPG